ncbi:MAG: hypothetical protein WBD99_04795 [Thermodesulfobacteriota bacterium]
MKNKLKSFLVPMLIGGLWGVIIYLVSSLILSDVPFASSLFFPVLFGGIAGIFSISVRTGISAERAIIVGLLAGFIYNLLSPIFPLLASILLGVCIGAGLGRDSGKSFGVLYRFVRVVKGVLLFPIFIFSGNLVSKFVFSIFNSSLIVWFIWGFLLFFAIYVTCAPFLDSCRSEGDRDTYIMLDEFKRESQGILEEIRRL